MKRKSLRKLPEERSDKSVLLCSQLSSLNSQNKRAPELVVCAHAKDPQLVSLKLALVLTPQKTPTKSFNNCS